jgi:hypothetical protein
VVAATDSGILGPDGYWRWTVFGTEVLQQSLEVAGFAAAMGKTHLSEPKKILQLVRLPCCAEILKSVFSVAKRRFSFEASRSGDREQLGTRKKNHLPGIYPQAVFPLGYATVGIDTGWHHRLSLAKDLSGFTAESRGRENPPVSPSGVSRFVDASLACPLKSCCTCDRNRAAGTEDPFYVRYVPAYTVEVVLNLSNSTYFHESVRV